MFLSMSSISFGPTYKTSWYTANRARKFRENAKNHYQAKRLTLDERESDDVFCFVFNLHIHIYITNYYFFVVSS